MGVTIRFPIKDLSALPDSPGVYKYYSAENELIYVGKAKSLKKRVSSYFNKSADHSIKTRKLVSEIESYEFVVVNTEFDAFLLENSVIKENQPRYNILLKDDKSFPYLCLIKERFPRVISTRRFKKIKGEYFGPYANVKAMNSVLELLQSVHKLRTCSYDLSQSNIDNGKFKVCLEYHIGNCLGPCEGKQSTTDYELEIEMARQILKGKFGFVTRTYKQKMEEQAAKMNFEAAHYYKSKLDLLEKFQSKSLVVNPKISDVDVFTISLEDNTSYVNYLKVSDGAINTAETIEAKGRLEESTEELLLHSIFLLRKKYNSNNQEVLTNIDVEVDTDDFQTLVPKIGDKKKLLDLSLKNILFYKKDRISKQKPSDSKSQALQILQKDLQLKELPDHIECFDNSNIQGTNPVASMVCFKKGRPSKKDYRHFKIKTVVGPDDFASMKEVVGRRYKRLQEEALPFPKLVVVDGGKGQLSSACEALKELGLYGQLPIVGIAKRLEEIYYPEDSIPVHIAKTSPSLKLLQHLRDEAHRFAITFHRDLRSKSQFSSSLDGISGIGPQTKTKLLRDFQSVKKIKEATLEALIASIGKSKAEIVKVHFEQVQENNE